MLACLIYKPKGVTRQRYETLCLFWTYPNTEGGNVVVDKALGVQVLHAAHNLVKASEERNTKDSYLVELLQT